MLETGIYKFKEEFCVKLNIPMNQANRRQEELLLWLTNFFDYEYLPGNPIRIHIKEVIGEYQPLPRKAPNQNKLNEQKKEDYKTFTIASLGPEYKPNSKSKVARDAIDSFGYEKYGHISSEAVARRYVKEPFDKYGESNGKYLWVFYSTYEPFDEETLGNWKSILTGAKLSEEEAANAFFKYAEGEDITQELDCYKKARKLFYKEYGDYPVRVAEWHLKITDN